MTLLFLIPVLLVLFAFHGVVRHLRQRVRQHGIHALTWRWLTGQAHHGKPLTTRGWSRLGAPKALTATGYTHRRHYWPRWQHAAWRIQWTLAAVLTCAGLAFQPRRTSVYLAVTAAAGLAYAASLTPERTRGWSHRRNYVSPSHVRLAPLAGIPAAVRPESWIEIPRDRSYALYTWPKGAELPKPQDRDTFADAAAATLGMGNAKRKWELVGPRLRLRLTPPIPSPDWVYLDSIEWSVRVPPDVGQDAIRRAIQEAGVFELILGVGEDGKIVKISLQHDSPHVVLSVDSGKGKSVTVRCLVSQVLFRGGIAAMLDNKLVSHPSLRGLPNVAYCDDIDKIHFFLKWLDKELTRRAEFVRAHTDIYGNLTGSPGPRLVVFLEEQNLMMNRLRSYWADRLAEDRALPKGEREYLPAVSPAVRGFENASYAGRELKIHLVFIAQRFTAEAAGGGAKGAAVRMNAGTRLLAGYDDDTWKMLVGKQTPMPPPSKHEGRMQLYVKGGGLTEVQVAFFTHAETRQFAEDGPARVPRELRHLTVFEPAGVTDPAPQPVQGQVIPAGGDGAAVTPQPAQLPPAVRNWMTLRQAREAGWIPHTWKNPAGAFSTLKYNARAAGRPVPQVKGKKGTQALYDAVELADFLERETSPAR